MLLHQDSSFVPFAQGDAAPRVHGIKDDYGREALRRGRLEGQS